MSEEKKQREMLWEYIAILNNLKKEGWDTEETKTIYEERKDYIEWISKNC